MIGPLDSRKATSNGQESPGSIMQGVRCKPERATASISESLASHKLVEPQRRVSLFPKERVKVKRGNPPRCNPRMVRLRSPYREPKIWGIDR